MKYIVDIKGEIEGDYEIIGKYEENPQGDLISRSALKEALKSNCKPELCHDYGTNWCETCCDHNEFEDLIDNAPTVDAFTLLQVKDLFDLNVKLIDEVENLKNERPHGEWIIDGHHRRCNYCNEYTCTEDREGNSIPDNFCPFCGADMRKGGAE